ncbi:hypothetical protein EWB00_004390 [Schistosoma japonicum]|uniref:Uncharacterized protein n=1 Tax=Schistosoma japonicum TaxID=6182 RepID=A0A4Z2D626_SCHJA|nr:hypothetical protein EWB00_004390 [Schistosoma japonicum]
MEGLTHQFNKIFRTTDKIKGVDEIWIEQAVFYMLHIFIRVNLGNRFLLLKTMKSSNKFNVNTPKHIRHCQKLCTFCSPDRYTILIHNEHLNQIHYTIITCGKISNFTNYNPVLINHNVNMNNPSNITTTTTHPNKSSAYHKKISNPLTTTISINVQTISKSIQKAKHDKVDYKQSKTKSNWGIINLSTCQNIHSGSEILDKYCGILSEKHNITRNPTKKYSSNKEKLLVENEADNEVMRYMSQFDSIENYAQIPFRNHKSYWLKNETFSANIRPPEPVGCQLLQMNSAPVSKGL